MLTTENEASAPAEQTSSRPAFRGEQVAGSWAPGKTYPAFVTDPRWNGWVIPHFTHEVAMHVAADNPNLYYMAQSDVFALVNEDGEAKECVPVTFAPTSIKVGDVALKVYAVGGYHWCWEAINAEIQPANG